MCGIIGYIGYKPAKEILLNGLYKLEYRGYDSTGIALLNGTLSLYKKKGKVDDLKREIRDKNTKGNIGIGHTRWATHGEPSDINAHPHSSEDNELALIHNGIIENYSTLKEELKDKGYNFKSETDSEVLLCFIEDIQKNNQCTLSEAVRLALTQIVGAYAIVVISTKNPDQMIAARKSSPLVIGINSESKEFFVASDATPIIEHTKSVIYLNDNEIAVIKRDQLNITSLDAKPLTPYIQTIDMKLHKIEKGDFDSFMLKEIFEQPNSIFDCLHGRLSLKSESLILEGIRKYLPQIIKADRIFIVGCGTSWHAGLVGEYIIEEFARTSVEVEYASEFRYRNPVIKEGDIVIAISQSGETADTLAAVELVKSFGAIVIGICNIIGSSISRASHEGAYIYAGPEIGVASTKAFTGQVMVLTLLALIIAKEKKTITQNQYSNLIREISQIPDKMRTSLATNNVVKIISTIYKNARNFLYLGRGYNFPVALEGALKLKEISYIHAEGYPAAEMKHGPIALIDEEMPIVVLATRDRSYGKIISNIQEIKSRKGKIIAVITKGDILIPKMVDHVIEIPQAHEALVPLISVIPLQLLSYHIAIMRGCNVDQPRNLAKSVTVE